MLVQWSKVPALYDMWLDIISESLILVQWSKVPALYDRSLDKICRFLIFVQWSNVPALYERSLDIICKTLILVQRSKYPAFSKRLIDIFCRYFYIVSIGFPNQVFLYGYLAIGYPLQVLRRQNPFYVLPGLTSIPNLCHAFHEVQDWGNNSVLSNENQNLNFLKYQGFDFFKQSFDFLNSTFWFLNTTFWYFGGKKSKPKQNINFSVPPPDSHIGWATSIPFASIINISMDINPWKFGKKTLKIGEFEKITFD